MVLDEILGMTINNLLKNLVSFRTRRRRVRNLALKTEISQGLRPFEMTSFGVFQQTVNPPI